MNSKKIVININGVHQSEVDELIELLEFQHWSYKIVNEIEEL